MSDLPRAYEKQLLIPPTCHSGGDTQVTRRTLRFHRRFVPRDRHLDATRSSSPVQRRPPLETATLGKDGLSGG